VEGNDLGLILVLSWYYPAGIMENNENTPSE
jgi:hypothetical protein